jgi:hypothetical protein
MQDAVEDWLNSSFGGYPHSGQGGPSGKAEYALRLKRQRASGLGGVRPPATLDEPLPTQGFGGIKPLVSY